MKRFFLLPLFMAVITAVFGEANYVYHEASTNTIGCSGGQQFRSVFVPSPSQSVTIGFKVEFQGYTNQVRIYYTTDGSTPSGSFGVASGTTQVLTASYVCTFGSPVVDVATATIPGQPAGTVVKYIVSAWHSGGGNEIFGNGPGTPCGCGTPTNSSTLATVFSFTVLPMELVHFEAKKGDSFTTLFWETATETNNRTFQIERSPDAQNWETLDQIAGAGTSFETKNYTWTDRQPLGGTSFYRLRQVDFDGQSSLSPVRKVERTGGIAFTVFPNPTVSSTTIKIVSTTEGEALVDLIDAAGRFTGTAHFLVGKGENLLEMPLAGMPAGWYTLAYSAADGHFTQRIFIKSE